MGDRAHHSVSLGNGSEYQHFPQSSVYVTLFNPYKPSVLFMGHRETEKTQIRRRRTRRLIRVSTVYLQNILLKIE